MQWSKYLYSKYMNLQFYVQKQYNNNKPGQT